MQLKKWHMWFTQVAPDGANWNDIRHGELLSAIYNSQGIKCNPTDFIRSVEKVEPTAETFFSMSKGMKKRRKK